ncbi:actin-related protein 6-like isoform X1 [Cryptomeria japonica]|uniref:actin-related protein 6-like isoform X1 n=1 Tax=Cryptomeria japonica TaxID=3369 RepID=UPI0027DA8996|nr:actin-related protein 6-like isoform X1 [Cryptomeria japonica]
MGSPSPMIVVDNGGGFCKAGFAGNKNPTAVVPNCLSRSHSSKKWLIADQLHHCDDIAGISIRRPFDRGFLVNADMQKEIWERLFKNLLKTRPSDSAGLLLVEPLFNLPSIQKATDELVFEDLGFQSLYVADSPSLVHLYEASRSPISLLARTQCSLIVDCGFSFTHAAPVYQNFTINYGVKRIDLGGKALTNYLKELVSYRAVNMMDETYIMDDVKEKLCFVSLDVDHDLQLARLQEKLDADLFLLLPSPFHWHFS